MSARPRHPGADPGDARTPSRDLGTADGGARSNDPHAEASVLVDGAPLDAATSALIVLHGRGASAEDIMELGRVVAPPNTAIIAPQAAGSTWYPRSFLSPIEANQPYVDSALALVARLVRRCRDAGIGRDRLFIAGFSQGACLACEFAARNPDAIAVAAIMTGGLVGERLDESRYPRATEAPRILLSSGDPDPHVPVERVRATAKLLADRGFAASLELFPGRPHTVTQHEVDAARLAFRNAAGSKE